MWTEKEDALLLSLPKPVSRAAAVEAFAKAHFKRTPEAIVAHLTFLGLQRPGRAQAWSQEEDTALAEAIASGLHPHTLGMAEAVRSLGVLRTDKSISARCYRLGYFTPPDPDAPPALKRKEVIAAPVAPAKPAEPVVVPVYRSPKALKAIRAAQVARDFALIDRVLARVFAGGDEATA